MPTRSVAAIEGFPLLMTVRNSAAARALVTSLRTVLTVASCPWRGTSPDWTPPRPDWLLELDSGSSAEDQCWAMIDVLRVLSFGVEAAEFAHETPRLRLVPPLA